MVTTLRPPAGGSGEEFHGCAATVKPDDLNLVSSLEQGNRAEQALSDERDFFCRSVSGGGLL